MVAVTLRSDSVRLLEEFDAYVSGIDKCGACEEAFGVRGVRKEELGRINRGREIFCGENSRDK